MKLLSHYTPRDGLIGIAGSETLRSTNFPWLNDKVEFGYAMKALYRAAMRRVLAQIPPDLRNSLNGEDEIRRLAEHCWQELKAAAKASDGYESLYVTSFACGIDQDEDDRGILTHWDRYTKMKGYCLQFDRDDICHLVDFEDTYCSYAQIELVNVKYGIDESDPEYLYLVEQLALVTLHAIGQGTGVSRLLPHPDSMHAPSYWERRLLNFCASHKDPFFKDERETRILAYPIASSRARIITGLTSPKPIYRRDPDPDSPRYIVMLEKRRPKLQPKRVLIGPEAEMEPTEVQALFLNEPDVVKPDFPI